MKTKYNFTCKKCGKEYSLLLTPNEYNKGKYRKYCSNHCSNSRNFSEKTKMRISETMKKRIENGIPTGIINDPECLEKMPLCTKECKFCGKQYHPSETELYSYKYCSIECKQKYHNEIYLKRLGGYRNGSGHGKSGWYKGIHCDSSWELAFVIYYLDNNLRIERNKEIRKYIYNGKEYNYLPDFITDEGLIEIKGYSTEQWEAKKKQNPDVKVLYRFDIQPYLDYVIKKYGKNFIDLYDNSKPIKNMKNNVITWVHKYDDDAKIYYTKVINPKDFEEHILNGWFSGRGKCYKEYKKIHLKTNNIFKR